MDVFDMDFESEDFIIRIRPSVHKSEWTGEIDIAIVSSGDNRLDDESYSQLMHFCKMVCASVPVMEADEKMRNIVHNYVLEVVDEDMEPMVQEENRLTVTGEDGNVVHLNFNSDTKGSA